MTSLNSRRKSSKKEVSSKLKAQSTEELQKKKANFQRSPVVTILQQVSEGANYLEDRNRDLLLLELLSDNQLSYFSTKLPVH